MITNQALYQLSYASTYSDLQNGGDFTSSQARRHGGTWQHRITSQLLYRPGCYRPDSGALIILPNGCGL